MFVITKILRSFSWEFGESQQYGLAKITYVKDTIAVKMDMVESKIERMMTLIRRSRVCGGIKLDLKKSGERIKASSIIILIPKHFPYSTVIINFWYFSISMLVNKPTLSVVIIMLWSNQSSWSYITHIVLTLEVVDQSLKFPARCMNHFLSDWTSVEVLEW